MNRNRAKKYLRKRGIEQQRIEMPNGGIQLHNLLADFEMYCQFKEMKNCKNELQILGYKQALKLKDYIKKKEFSRIEIRQGSDGEPRYVLTQKQFDKI